MVMDTVIHATEHSLLSQMTGWLRLNRTLQLIFNTHNMLRGSISPCFMLFIFGGVYLWKVHIDLV